MKADNISIKQEIEQILQLMGFDVKVTEKLNDKNERVFNIKTINKKDSSFLIGQKGVNLKSLQHLIRLVIFKKNDKKTKFTLDVNDYIKENNQRLIQQAQIAAKEAQDKHKTVILPPMTAYQRRLIHLELENNKNVYSQSVGEGKERKIIIKPKSDIL